MDRKTKKGQKGPAIKMKILAKIVTKSLKNIHLTKSQELGILFQYHHSCLFACLSVPSLLDWGFILPQQSVCQSIFFKIQGTYLLYAILWPLIKNFLDSSPQYLSNVTFGTSLAFQMREEYMFETIYFWNLNLKGVNISITQLRNISITQLRSLRMFLYILELRIKN